jgi:hypothetical protein
VTKYHAIRTEVDGIVFPSRKEARRYQELQLAEKAGVISGLERQVKYPLTINGVKVADYICDFRYRERGVGVVVEDTKGMRTPVYRLKKKIMKALYDIDILET